MTNRELLGRLRNAVADAGGPPARAGRVAKKQFQQAVKVTTRGELNKDLVSSLLRGHTGILRIRDALPVEHLEAIKHAVREHPMQYYLDPVVGKLGPSHFEHRHSPDDYFRLAKHHAEAWPALTAASRSLVAEVVDILEDIGLHAVETALHKNGTPLNAVVFRDIRRGVALHIDWHAVDIPAWLDDSIQGQMSWCLYLEVPPVGGELRVFPVQWKLEDEVFRAPDSFEFSSAVIPASAEPACVAPGVGDFVLFNSKNFHDVTMSDTSHPRIAASSFVGVAGHRGYLWT